MTVHRTKKRRRWARLRGTKNSYGVIAVLNLAKHLTTTYYQPWISMLMLWLHWYDRNKIGCKITDRFRKSWNTPRSSTSDAFRATSAWFPWELALWTAMHRRRVARIQRLRHAILLSLGRGPVWGEVFAEKIVCCCQKKKSNSIKFRILILKMKFARLVLGSIDVDFR